MVSLVSSSLQPSSRLLGPLIIAFNATRLLYGFLNSFEDGSHALEVSIVDHPTLKFSNFVPLQL